MTLTELMNNEALASEFFSKPTPEEAQEYAKSKGVEVSLDELKSLAAQIKQSKGMELSAEELGMIAGGTSSYDRFNSERVSNQELYDKIVEIFTSW